MMRHCDGTDPNLHRVVLAAEFDTATMTRAEVYDRIALQGTRVIRCQCGQRFDDTHRSVIHPHDPIGGGLKIGADG